jgi:hypothetical protein
VFDKWNKNDGLANGKGLYFFIDFEFIFRLFYAWFLTRAASIGDMSAGEFGRRRGDRKRPASYEAGGRSAVLFVFYLLSAR